MIGYGFLLPCKPRYTLVVVDPLHPDYQFRHERYYTLRGALERASRYPWGHSVYVVDGRHASVVFSRVEAVIVGAPQVSIP